MGAGRFLQGMPTALAHSSKHRRVRRRSMQRLPSSAATWMLMQPRSCALSRHLIRFCERGLCRERRRLSESGEARGRQRPGSVPSDASGHESVCSGGR
eukprot:1006936-Amphidinium_carterae.1